MESGKNNGAPGAAKSKKGGRSRSRVATAEVSANAARSGTQAAPYVRSDGEATRSTTVHFPVDLHQKLRVEAAKSGVHMSSIVAEAVREWFAKRR
jgi:hypothetical protein